MREEFHGENLRRLRRELDDTAVLLPSGADMCYLTGFCERDAPVYAYITRDDVSFLAHESYEGDLPGGGEKQFFGSRKALEQELGGLAGPEKILLGADLDAEKVLALREKAPETDLDLFEDVFDNFRAVKTPEEVEKVEEAVKTAEKALGDIGSLDVEGMTEKELAGFIEAKMADHGGDRPSFDTIVAAGENGADPHHYPGNRVIEAGEPVVVDIGVRQDGYVSDQTRTFVFGEADDKTRKVHETVLKAQKAAIEAIEPGAEASDVDGAAREIIEEAGHGDEFIHSTGHGVGIEVHEEPLISGKSDDVLEEGMLVTVEPGIYMGGEFGVRMEDIVLVTEDGAERLNTFSRALDIGKKG